MHILHIESKIDIRIASAMTKINSVKNSELISAIPFQVSVKSAFFFFGPAGSFVWFTD